MHSIVYDLRYAFRTLTKNPILTTVALISLAVGIGANTAIFTIMDRVLLRALPVRDPQQLGLLRSPGGWSGFVETSYNDDLSFSWPKYRALRDQSPGVFDGVIARFPFSAAIAVNGQTERARTGLESGNYFDVLGVRPALGRLVTNDDTQKTGANPVAVLTHSYWIRRFGGRHPVLKPSITITRRPIH